MAGVVRLLDRYMGETRHADHTWEKNGRMNYLGLDARWDLARRALGIHEDARTIVLSDGLRRIFVHGQTIHKVVLSSAAGSEERRNGILAEYNFLKSLRGLSGFPCPQGYQTSAEGDALAMDVIEGRPWSTMPRVWSRDLAILLRLAAILWKCSLRGVAHNDVRPENVVVSAVGKCHLIDFDQATYCSSPRAFLSNLLGIADQPGVIKVSFVKTTAKTLLPQWLSSFLSRAKNWLERRRMVRPIILPSEASVELKTVAEAWEIARSSDANAPAQGVAYYSLTYDGVYLPGERPWKERWETLRNLQDYSGKRILELGCNMALLSSFLLKQGASAAMAVDHDEKILQSAQLFARATHVRPTFGQANFDSTSDWERELSAFQPDIVFSLNVLNWVSDKDRFLRFLSRWPVVILEGHDSYEIEAARMKRFADFRCELASISERGRPLLICYRQ
jgi:predicted Ser/Thr protein kinase